MKEKNYVNHPWIHSNTIEKRRYQENIVATCLTGNTLVVIPTGMGKTSIAAMVAAARLQKDMNSRIIILAPTKPLVNQHMKSFKKFIKLDPENMLTITGEIPQDNRRYFYSKADMIFSTPQTIRNDLNDRILNLTDFSLLVIDEAHRSIGSYAYTDVAKKYSYQAKDPLLLALTASPGSFHHKINEVKKALYIKNVEIRSKDDEDVKPYVHPVEKEFIEVELTEGMKEIQAFLQKSKKDIIDKLMKWRIISHPMISKSQILKLQKDLAKKGTGIAYMSMSLLAELIKIDHAIMLLETQCISALKEYFDDLQHKEDKASKRMLNNENIKKTIEKTEEMLNKGEENPKIEKLKEIIQQELENNKNTQIMIFVQLRSTIRKIMSSLKGIKYASPVEFVGQAKKKGSGMNQKQQMQILEEFSMGFYNILVASSIGEEGLDIAETDTVIFYEAVPSAIRRIQRSGRTARTQAGKVITLITKDTRDEIYHWSGYNKEKKMNKILYGMQKQRELTDFSK